MEFRDEYEDSIGDRTFYVQVEGEIYSSKPSFSAFIVTDEIGNDIDEDADEFIILRARAKKRQFHVELHGADFDYYERQFVDEY